MLAKAWGKQIGDQVRVRSEDGTQMDYIICGLSQTMNNFGHQCFLNLSAYQTIEPSYERQTIQVYLEPGKEIDAMIQTLESRFKVSSPTFREEPEGERALAREAAERVWNLQSHGLYRWAADEASGRKLSAIQRG